MRALREQRAQEAYAAEMQRMADEEAELAKAEAEAALEQERKAKAAEDERLAAEAAELARQAAEAQAAEEARLKAEAEAAEEARRKEEEMDPELRAMKAGADEAEAAHEAAAASNAAADAAAKAAAAAAKADEDRNAEMERLAQEEAEKARKLHQAALERARLSQNLAGADEESKGGSTSARGEPPSEGHSKPPSRPGTAGSFQGTPTAELELLRAKVVQLQRMATAQAEKTGILTRTLESNAAEMSAREQHLHTLRRQLDAKDRQVEDMQAQLDAGAQQLAMAGEAFRQKDDALYSLSQQVSVLATRLEQSEASNEHLQGLLREATEQIQSLQPGEMVDVALSARSFDERVTLQERDNAITAEKQQVQLLTNSNASLVENLNAVEKELEAMQEDLIAKDQDVAELRQQLKDSQRETAAVERELKKHAGRDFVVDQATRQNTDLLQLLEQAEERAQTAETEAERLKARVSELQEKYHAKVKEAAEFEAQAEHNLRETTLLAKELEEYRDGTSKRMADMASRMHATTETATVQVEGVQEELQVRRRKQYELLAKVQELEDEASNWKRKAEASAEQVRVLQQRVYDVDGQLIQANEWRAQEAKATKEMSEMAAQKEAALKEQLGFAEQEVTMLKGRMNEMSSSALKLAKRERELEQHSATSAEARRQAEGKLIAMEGDVRELESELDRLRRRVKNAEAVAEQAKLEYENLRVTHETLLDKTRGIGRNPDWAGASMGSTGMQGTGKGSLPTFGADAILGGPDSPQPGATATTTASQQGLQRLESQLSSALNLKRLIFERCIACLCNCPADFLPMLRHASSMPGSHFSPHNQPANLSTASSTDPPLVALMFGGRVPSAQPFHVGVKLASHLALHNAGGAGGQDGTSQAVNSASSLQGGLPERGIVLDFSGLGLTDEDVGVLAEVLKCVPMSPADGPAITLPDTAPKERSLAGSVPAITTAVLRTSEFARVDSPLPVIGLDLRSNHITDVGALLLGSLLDGTSATPMSAAAQAGRAPHLASNLGLLDLRDNHISLDGSRALAELVRKNVRMGIQHVYVGTDGLVRALGNRNRAGAGAPSLGIVSVVDTRANNPKPQGDFELRARELIGRVRSMRLGNSAAAVEMLQRTRALDETMPSTNRSEPVVVDINRGGAVMDGGFAVLQARGMGSTSQPHLSASAAPSSYGRPPPALGPVRPPSRQRPASQPSPSEFALPSWRTPRGGHSDSEGSPSMAVNATPTIRKELADAASSEADQGSKAGKRKAGQSSRTGGKADRASDSKQAGERGGGGKHKDSSDRKQDTASRVYAEKQTLAPQWQPNPAKSSTPHAGVTSSAAPATKPSAKPTAPRSTSGGVKRVKSAGGTAASKRRGDSAMQAAGGGKSRKKRSGSSRRGGKDADTGAGGRPTSEGDVIARALALDLDQPLSLPSLTPVSTMDGHSPRRAFE